MNIQAAVSLLNGVRTFGKNPPSVRHTPRVKGKVYLNKFGNLQLGKGIGIMGRPWATQLTVQQGADLIIGDNVFINAGVGIAATLGVSIGNNVKIGPRTSIFDSAYHELDSLDVGKDLRQRITIHDNVWIGTACLILPGVTIGRNSVIAAGSTVNKDIPENSLAAGVPAKVIRELTVNDGWLRK